MRRRLLVSLAILGTLCLPALAQLPTDAEIKTILHNFIERDHWGVGMVVGIVDEHGTRVISYGKLANGDSPAVDGDTLFEIGSITKTFTTLLLQDMVARGEMCLDDPVEKFLPATVKVPDWKGRKITLQDLATHTSGLPRDGMKEWTFAGLYDFLSHLRLRRKPGTKVEYSNLGFALLGHAIELKAGTNYEVLVQERICRPLQMDSTCIRPTPELRPRWAKSHGQENRPVWDMDAFYSGLGGAGAIRSSANDMLKYLAANLALTNSSLTPLMEKTHSVQIPQAFESFGKTALAMPWWIFHRDDAELITHGGATGQKAFIGFDKKLKRGVVVLANRTDPWQQAVEPLGLYLLHPPAKDPPPVKVSPEILNSYVGLYHFPEVPETMLAIRRDGEQLISQNLNAAGSDWTALSDTEFSDPQSDALMKFIRSSRRTTVEFTHPLMRTWRAKKLSDHVPDSLFRPMLQPLAAAEYSPRKDSDLQGTWRGSIRPWYWPLVSQRGIVNIAERTPGAFFAELNIPADKVEKLPVAVIYHAPGVELVISSGDGLFRGKLNADRTKMTGHFIQGKRSIRVTLRRADPQPDIPPATATDKPVATK